MTSDFEVERQLQAGLGPDFSIEREIVGGGMSRVFVARDRRLERDVVVKVLAPALAATLSAERFEREIKVVAHLQHPHIVPVLSAGQASGGLPYYVMPFVRGESLRARMARGALSTSDAISILLDVAKALAYAHGEGVVHRDVKPDNVLLSGSSAMVTDFGIAKAVSTARAVTAHEPTQYSLTQIGMAVGTPAYMAPEQAATDPATDHRADIYSWGVMAYELLAGQHPFAGRTTVQELFAAHAAETPRTYAPGLVAALVMRCLEKDAARRPQHASDLIQALTTAGATRESRGVSRRAVVLTTLALLVAAVSVVWWWRSTRDAAGGAAAHTIAVMPFATVGSDSSQQYVALGLTDELATTLAKIPGLQVAARRSAFSFRGRLATPQDVGRALGVQLLLDGTVRRSGNRVRVTTQLTSASDGLALWSDSYDGDARDVFAMQDSIARAIVAALHLRLASGAQASLARERTTSLEAHDLYMQARFEASTHTESGLRASLPLYQRAADLDPKYPLPWVGMADAYAWLADEYVPAREAYDKAKDALERAIGMAPNLAEAHTVLGWVLYAYDWSFADAERALRRAIALDPSSAWAHSNYAFVLVSLDRPDEALAEMQHALTLDPLSPSLSANLEWLYLIRREYDKVIAQHAVTRGLAPAYFFADSWVGAALRELGRFEESIRTYERAQAIVDRPIPGMALVYARAGDTVRARNQLRLLLQYAQRAHVKPEAIASVYANLGDLDRAFEWLDRAIERRSNEAVWLRHNPAFDPMRADPRFAEHMRRVFR